MPEILPRPGEAGAKGDPSISADPAGLARRPDFRLGDVDVRPSIRTVEGPGGVATAEPRVMQVLVALADARGAVLTRDDLLRLCWDGRIVGDDSINRAIAELRALARATDAGFVVETIPRIGYRLTETAAEGTAPGPARKASPAPVARRAMIGAALAVTAASIGGFSLWSARRTRADPRVADLLDRGRQALRDELPDRDEQGVGFLEEATRLAPDNAAAWGLLALAHRNVLENAPPGQTAAALRASERAARRALALDPRQGDALAALATLRPPFGDWLAAENRLLEVLRIAPDNLAAISALVTLLQSVGRRRESWTWNERAAALDPLSPVHQFRKALKHWIFGRVPEADLTIDRALQLWPRHAAVWNARLMIFAFTGVGSPGTELEFAL